CAGCKCVHPNAGRSLYSIANRDNFSMALTSFVISKSHPSLRKIKSALSPGVNEPQGYTNKTTRGAKVDYPCRSGCNLAERMNMCHHIVSLSIRLRGLVT